MALLTEILAPIDDLPASSIGNTPSGGIAATDVQAAINELDSEKFAKTGGSINGNVGFTGTGRRITGAFGGVPVANRTLFQTSIANDATTVGVIPNGTGNAAYFQFSNSSDPDNSSYGYIGLTPDRLTITSTALGSGTKLPIDIDGKLRIDTGGNVGIGTSTPRAPLHSFNLSNFGNPDTTGTGTTGVSARIQGGSVNMDFGVYSSGNTWIQSRLNTDNSFTFQLVLNPVGGPVLVGPGGFGYAAGIGAGGTVTQPTSKATSVTLNKICGTVTTHNQSMTGGNVVAFDVIDSLAVSETVAVVCIDTSTPFYWEYRATATTTGGGRITVILEKLAGSASRADNVILKFALLRISNT